MSRILNNNKALIVIIVILLLTNIALTTFFLGMKPPPRKDMRDEPDRPPKTSALLKNDLGFTEDQMNQYDSLRKEHWKAIKPLFKEINATKDSFYLNLRDTVINETELDNMADSIGMKQKKIDRLISNYFRSIRDICTPRQMPIYDSLIQKTVKRMISPNWKGEGNRKKPDSTDNRKN